MRIHFLTLMLLCSATAWSASTRPAIQPATEPATEPADGAVEEPGITLRVYRVGHPMDKILPLAENQTPNVDVLVPSVHVTPADWGDESGPLVGTVTGSLLVKTPGTYAFERITKERSRLTIDGKTIDGPVALKAGEVPLRIDFFYNDPPHARLILRWKPPGAADFADVPTASLRTEGGVTRVVAPGPKQLAGDNRPGDRSPLQAVHPGYDLSTIRPEDLVPKVSALGFLPNGTLVVGTFSPLQRGGGKLPDIDSKVPDKLYALAPDKGENWKVRPVADGLYEPLGVVSVGNAVYVSQRKEVTKLTDPDGDGFFDKHETAASGWEGWNYHEFTFGLVHHDGKLYASLSTPMAPPGWKGMRENSAPGGLLRGGVMEIDLKSGITTFIAGGLRTPNGLGIGPGGTLFVSDNQGTWMPANQLDAILPGHFYGHYNNTNVVENLADRFPDGGFPSLYADLPRTPPALYLPQNELDNSPTQSLLVPSGPYKGQMLIGELTAGGIRRANLEMVNGVWQGCAFRFSQGFEVGINRMAFAPDGSLYVGGIGAGGNWKWRDTKEGIQRLAPNGKTAFEMLAVHATPDGFEVEFTKPVPAAFLSNPANFKASWWTYQPTMHYGGPKIDEHDLTVEKAEPAADGRSVRLTIPDAQTGGVVHLVTDPTSTDGDADVVDRRLLHPQHQAPRRAGRERRDWRGKPLIPAPPASARPRRPTPCSSSAPRPRPTSPATAPAS